jgi:glycosyltransferase involved in cell wall biosynthesis
MVGAEKVTRIGSRLKILHVIPTLGAGGSERFLHDLTDTSDSAQFEHGICVLESLNAFPVRWTSCLSIMFLSVGVGLSDPRAVYLVLKALRRVFREWRPDVIHSHLWHATRPTALATLGTNIPHVVHLHDAWSRLEATNLRDFLIRSVCNLALRRTPTRFIAVSEHTRDYTQRFVSAAENHTTVIPNGVNLAKFTPGRSLATCVRNDDSLAVVMVGWLEEFKGQGLLIQALALLKERGVIWRARFAGAGRMREQYIAMSRELGVHRQIEFCGLVEDVPGFLRAADVLALPSATEGMPLSILEAMATGLPVVASRAGGIPEVIEDGCNGLLLVELSSIALANALFRLAEPGLRARLGAAARSTVCRRFDLQRTTRSIEEFYRDVIEQRSSDDDEGFG